MSKFLDRLAIIPYQLELRDLLDACLYALEQIATAAASCCELEKPLSGDRDTAQQAFVEKGQAQTRIFDHIDAFLSAYARLSLLIFPTSKSDEAMLRARTLQSCLGLGIGSGLNDRELRNAWMHHDERLDANVSAGQQAGGQLFKRESEITDANRKGFLRIVAIDTLKVWYHDQHNASQCASLTDLRTLLQKLDEERKGAFDELE